MYEKSESGIPRFRSFREGGKEGPGGDDGDDDDDDDDGRGEREEPSELEEPMQCVCNLRVLGKSRLLLRTLPTTYPPRRRR